jgi:hypothetical protein
MGKDFFNFIDPIAFTGAFLFTASLGFVWFGRLFGKIWLPNSRWTEKKLEKAMQNGLGGIFAGTFLQYVVGHLAMIVVLNFFGCFNHENLIDSLADVFVRSNLLYLAFVLPVQLKGLLWEGDNLPYFLVTSSHRYAGFVGGAIVYTLLDAINWSGILG